MKKEILIIVNPKAGKGKINKFIPDICDNLEKQGYELEVIYTSETCNGEQVIENYVRYIDTVVVCGGDGTLNEVCNGIIKTNKKIKVAFIPFGTANDFAKTLKVPINKVKLSKKLSKYVRKSVDMGCFNNSKFFDYVAAFGMFTDISYYTKQSEKNKLGKLAYYKNALKDRKKMKAYQTTIVTDNEIIKDKFIYGSITNSISIAGFKWFKRNDVKVDDGLFELIFVKKPEGKFALLKIIFAILRKKYDQKNIYYLKSKHLQIEFEEEVNWTLDGENGGVSKNVLIENKNSKIVFLVPKK